MVSPAFNTDPQASMLHNQAPQGEVWGYTDEFQRQINAFWQQAQGQAMNAQAPSDAWQWPKSDPQPAPKPEAPHFDDDAHRKFMQSLG